MKVIAVFTESGFTARLVSKHRPRRPIIAFSTIQETRRRLSLNWGVFPRTIGKVRISKNSFKRRKKGCSKSTSCRSGTLWESWRERRSSWAAQQTS